MADKIEFQLAIYSTLFSHLLIFIFLLILSVFKRYWKICFTYLGALRLSCSFSFLFFSSIFYFLADRTLTLYTLRCIHHCECRHVDPSGHLLRHRVPHNRCVFVQPGDTFRECFPVFGGLG